MLQPKKHDKINMVIDININVVNFLANFSTYEHF